MVKLTNTNGAARQQKALGTNNHDHDHDHTTRKDTSHIHMEKLPANDLYTRYTRYADAEKAVHWARRQGHDFDTLDGPCSTLPPVCGGHRCCR